MVRSPSLRGVRTIEVSEVPKISELWSDDEWKGQIVNGRGYGQAD